ncbi:MAG: TIGR01777 family oxidoreductase [Caldimicrobium sp.]|nr:TIGR01777 family oxidoreductase [Caldimicrobium sp.]MCX7613382.1 TIGR01777 family oxidoreductase [Caldimicrobium sp.]MDW8094914.1 TIGR01777 family oxidoreductase [Caldimicrobium sp.]MDW8182733.1 TIGR01777 family oxidoreductase [Caldimicrobium sp.]
MENQRSLLLIGGTGFIGSFLSSFFLKRGWKVFVLVRNSHRLKSLIPGTEALFGDPLKDGEWQKVVPERDLVINLVGETIFKRWTPEYKRRIWDSRVISTEKVVSALRPGQVLFNASAVGYYGDAGEEILTEESPRGNLFVSELCEVWEKKALEGESKGARVLVGRFGIVMGKGGGMLSVILPIFKLGLGGKLGSGRQWFPWIHILDLARAIEFLYYTEERGIFNITSPEPVRNEDMTKVMGKILKRPTFFPVPKIGLKILYGELAEVIMASARVIPQRLLRLGFKFEYESFEKAFKASIE